MAAHRPAPREPAFLREPFVLVGASPDEALPLPSGADAVAKGSRMLAPSGAHMLVTMLQPNAVSAFAHNVGYITAAADAETREQGCSALELRRRGNVAFPLAKRPSHTQLWKARTLGFVALGIWRSLEVRRRPLFTSNMSS